MLRTLAELTSYRKSYRAGLLQTKAFRVLKKRTNDVLKPHGLNASDWGILGLLMDSQSGLPAKELALQIGVKAPYVTRSLVELKKRGMITITDHVSDSRVKVVHITKTGKQFVNKVEKEVVVMLLDTFEGISQRDRLGYVKTLMAITDRYGDETIRSTDLDHLRDD